ncbi:MAG: hypothetical protein KF688_19335 [Pirellulales bacterium]|nr:hypothetical protein [Pirellulales bacterium]
MDLKDEHELDRLVSALLDDGPSEQELHRLEELLIDDAELQSRYWQLVSTHVALGVAIGGDRQAAAPPTRAGSMLHWLKPRLWTGGRKAADRLEHRAAQPLRIAAAIALVAVGMTLWSRLAGPEHGAAPVAEATTSQHWTVDRVPTITHVSWDGPTFSDDAGLWQPISAIDGGSISLPVKQDREADGYLFCLPPGATVELVATFDATSENCLSVAEITSRGDHAVRKATFTNSGVGPRPLHANPRASNRRYGVLGRWSEINTTPSPRYFLLTGSHKNSSEDASHEWQVSEMAVLLQREDVIHIGWEDAPAKSAKVSHEDYDDLAATLFVSYATNPKTPRTGLRVVGSDVGLVEGTPSIDGKPHRIALGPGDAILVKVASEARLENGLFLVDATTGEVEWATSNKSASIDSLNLGAAAVFNDSTTPRDVLIVGAHREPCGEGEDCEAVWKESSRRILYEQTGFDILGFEDSKIDDDYNDIRVSVLRGRFAAPQERP